MTFCNLFKSRLNLNSATCAAKQQRGRAAPPRIEALCCALSPLPLLPSLADRYHDPGRARSRPTACGTSAWVTQYPEGDPWTAVNIKAFRQKMRDLGWTEGRNLAVEYRWTAADPTITRRFAAKLVARPPAVRHRDGEW
jgi:hypothetical protein